MNSVQDLTLKMAMSVDRFQRSFLSDRSLSKHLHIQVNGSNLALIYVEAYVIEVVSGSYFGV